MVAVAQQQFQGLNNLAADRHLEGNREVRMPREATMLLLRAVLSPGEEYSASA